MPLMELPWAAINRLASFEAGTAAPSQYGNVRSIASLAHSDEAHPLRNVRVFAVAALHTAINSQAAAACRRTSSTQLYLVVAILQNRFFFIGSGARRTRVHFNRQDLCTVRSFCPVMSMTSFSVCWALLSSEV